MASPEDMLDIGRRMEEELAAGPLDHHRLREIETIVRLLLPHLTRRLVEALHREGESGRLHTARAAFLDLRRRLAWTAERRDAETAYAVQTALLDAARAACLVLEALGAR